MNCREKTKTLAEKREEARKAKENALREKLGLAPCMFNRYIFCCDLAENNLLCLHLMVYCDHLMI